MKMKQFNRTYAEVNLDAIRHNIDEVHKNIKEGTKVMAIVKANAYGHGAVQVAKALYDQVDAYGVAMIEEAIELRKAGIDKAGYTFSIEEPPFTDELFKELKDVSDEWLNGKKEKGFCVGYFDREYIEMDKIAIVRNAEGEIKAFATIMPMYDNKTLSVDLMRFKDIQLNGIMDFIFVNLFEYSKENGYEFFNLGLVPLAEVGESKYSFIREKIAYQIFINGNFIYSFKGLKKFKDKYASDWNEKYIAYKKESSLVITCIQILKLLSQEKDTSDKN